MLVISFDAVGDRELNILAQYPAVSAFMKNATIHRDVSSIFVTNTYPIHTSIATGVLPNVHGITANTKPFPDEYPIWSQDERDIRLKTIWQAAFEKGIETAAVLWPVTGYSKTIRYNIPEIHKRPNEHQLVANLKSGSKLLQIQMLLRHGKFLKSASQPNLDDFATHCLVDIIKKHNPGLALIHLFAYDALCHKYGKGSSELEFVFKSLDRNLALLLDAVGKDRDVLIFSDHSQINVHTSVNLNKMLVKMGLLTWDGTKFLPGDSGCFIECCGGSAFFHAGSLTIPSIKEIRNKISKTEGFRRFLTAQEMRDSGQTAVFGFCAQDGYCYETFPTGHKATHGYPLDMPDYNVFYMIRGAGFLPGKVNYGGSILDITPIIANSLGLKLN